MVEKIKSIKDRLLAEIEKDMGEKGASRIDPEMFDAVKDLAEAEEKCWEAEYYRAVTEAMDGRSGYMPMGYMPDGEMNRMGYRDSMGRYSRRGYDRMGYQDSVEGIRNILNSANPDEKERMKQMLRSELGM